MAKDRVITTWGPHQLPDLTGTTGATETPTAWNRLGPMLATRTYVKAVFLTAAGAISTSANRVKIRAAFAPTSSGISTAHTSVIASRTSTEQATQIASTIGLLFNWFRSESTGLTNGQTARVFMGAIP